MNRSFGQVEGWVLEGKRVERVGGSGLKKKKQSLGSHTPPMLTVQIPLEDWLQSDDGRSEYNQVISKE